LLTRYANADAFKQVEGKKGGGKKNKYLKSRRIDVNLKTEAVRETIDKSHQLLLLQFFKVDHTSPVNFLISYLTTYHSLLTNIRRKEICLQAK